MPKSLPANCVPLMGPHHARKLIQQLARNTSRIAWSRHALDRMVERDIIDRVVIDVLRTGYVKGEIEPGKGPGEWKAKVCKEVKGRREVGVVTIVMRAKRLFVKTVEWEDL